VYATTVRLPLTTTAYQACLLYDPALVKKRGSAFPIKVQLCDGNGNNLSSPSIALHAQSVTQVSTSVIKTSRQHRQCQSGFGLQVRRGAGGLHFQSQHHGPIDRHLHAELHRRLGPTGVFSAVRNQVGRPRSYEAGRSLAGERASRYRRDPGLSAPPASNTS